MPALFLTSAEDAVIPPSGVSSYAARLREAYPGRHVAVAMLRGAHCQLVRDDREALSRELEALMKVAGLER